MSDTAMPSIETHEQSTKRGPISSKWQRVTTTKLKRKKGHSWVPYGQLYREIAEGYDHFVAERIRSRTLKP